MSDYTGPGLYEIVPVVAQDKNLNVWTGTKDQGAQIKLYRRNPSTENAQFEIVSAGGAWAQPEKGDREYHILVVHSGLYVTAGDEPGVITQELRSPLDGKVRWKIVGTGDGSYQINNVNGKVQFNVRGSGTSEGTELINYHLENGNNTKFLLKVIRK
ncbi:hypothetical protein H2198_010411 [Neophaeococcomyces mojaviensis]|uniref:Uncharacterized protein n=1 Tax=Neophaeococcomyces mojaviensis TaxID=3383035 RepID=A0ACC2ZRR9_9EURO|nr:hypothetical protein H2198_010411 [Knufia sp. JES_112]